MKEIEDDKNKWKDKPYSWIRKINVKMFIYYSNLMNML